MAIMPLCRLVLWTPAMQQSFNPVANGKVTDFDPFGHMIVPINISMTQSFTHGINQSHDTLQVQLFYLFDSMLDDIEPIVKHYKSQIPGTQRCFLTNEVSKETECQFQGNPI